MKKYVCKLCGYVYDESFGEPDNGIANCPIILMFAI